MKMLLLLGLLLISTVAWGEDKDGNYYAQGARTCGEFIRAAQDQKGAAYTVTHGWVAGYITAYNAHTRNTYSILGSSDLDSAMLWLENWCKANPLRGLSSGMEVLTAELYPRRHKTGKEAGR